MKRATLIVAFFFIGCGSVGLNLKQDAVIGLQVSETALEGTQTVERSLCFTNPTTESGPTCTNPAAKAVGLTDAAHQAMARLFIKAADDQILAAGALIAWKSGDPPPANVGTYKADATAILAEAAKLLGAGAQPLIAKAQTLVNTASSVATAVGVK